MYIMPCLTPALTMSTSIALLNFNTVSVQRSSDIKSPTDVTSCGA